MPDINKSYATADYLSKLGVGTDAATDKDFVGVAGQVVTDPDEPANSVIRRYNSGIEATSLPHIPIKSYTVEDIYFQMKSVQLTDSIQRILNEHSAVNGLEIVYSDFANTQVVTDASTGTVFAEVRHAASRALRAFMISRFQDTVDTQTCDSFASSYHKFNSWHWRLGALYFPHQPIKSTDAYFNNTQTYLYSADACGKVAGGSRCSIGYNDWLTYHEKAIAIGVPFGAFVPLVNPNDATDIGSTLIRADNFTGKQMHAVSLERSTLFNLSGIPINNSRVLSFHGTFDSDTAPSVAGSKTKDKRAMVHDIYLQYVRLARVFLNNVEVEQ